jgi:hypothetical protein
MINEVMTLSLGGKVLIGLAAGGPGGIDGDASYLLSFKGVVQYPLSASKTGAT